MKYLPREENKLVQAIRRKDWPAVRNILENEPHLIETSDEDGYTPLMRAVINNAPDDVLENMIKTATVENLEHQTLLGDSILHFLVRYARVSTLRRVLQRTNTKINTQDKYFGQTPLHYCLDDWGTTTRSYEYHKEAAIVLITYGASASIKDKEGKTPLDLYDENKCKGYEKTTRSEKKKQLRDLLEELSIPSEILARGPDAVKAFKDALKNGEITVVNSRLMFLGKEGSGKTSCVKAMLGKEFNKDEPSTDGIVTTVFQTVGEDCSKWEEQKDVDVRDLTNQNFEHGIAADIAKKLIQPMTSKFVADVEGISLSDSTASTSTAVKLPESVIHPSLQKRSKGKHVSQDTGVPPNQLNKIRKIVLDNFAKKSSGPIDITSIWDYGGQMEYYLTHRFFLTDGTYGVVFSLLDDLDAFAEPRDLHKGRFEMTNLQFNIFWIRSIYEHAVLLHGTDEKPLISGIARPPISLIGTHKDQLEGSEAEKQALIESKFRRIFKEIEDTPYESHVDHNMYAVDNTAEFDEGIERLKNNVGRYMKAMNRTVPMKWMDFQNKVQDFGKNTLCMSLDKISKIAADCDINETDLIHVLNYLNDVGIILYSPTNKKLKNIVITNIHMLIEIFMKIITVVEPDDVEKAPVYKKPWRQLNKEGILTEPLARHLWKNQLAASEDDDDVVFEVFIEIMKMFGLLFEKKNKSKEDPRLFVVPSRGKTKTNDDLEIKKDEEQTVSIYVTPKNFLPDTVYDILVVGFVNLNQDKGFCDDPQLFHNKSEIGFNDNHYLTLGRISIDNKQSLKLEISRMKEMDADRKEKTACKPDPSVCMEVLNILKKHLDEVYPSKRIVGYDLKIICLICSNQKKPHFQELEKCLKNKNMTCNKTGQPIAMSTAYVQSLFKADLRADIKGKKSVLDIFAKKLKTGEKTDRERGCAEDLTNTVMDSNGGDLELGKIKLQIPCGAIEGGVQIDISLGHHIVDLNDVPVLNLLESRISPIVSCGPPGTVFKKHCSLSFPHYAVNEKSWEFTVHVKENSLETWKRIENDDKNTTFSVQSGRCYIQTNHFSKWFLSGKLVELYYGKKTLKLGLFGKMLKEHHYLLRVRIWSEHDFKLIEEEENKENEKPLDIFTSISVKFEEMNISISDLYKGWHVQGPSQVTLDNHLIWYSNASHAFILKLNDASVQSLVATVSLTQGSNVRHVTVHTGIQHPSSPTVTHTPHTSTVMSHTTSTMDRLTLGIQHLSSATDTPHSSSVTHTPQTATDTSHTTSTMDTSNPSSATGTPHPTFTTDTPNLGIHHPSSATDTPHPSSITHTPHAAADTSQTTSTMDTPNPSSATGTPHTTFTIDIPNLALSDKEFGVLKTEVSQWYDSNGSVPMLKVLFRDKVDIHELSPVTHTVDLLNKILARGHLSSQNLGLLCDTISITKHLGLLSKIKEKLPSFPDVKEGTISTKFTPHRQKLMKLGMVLAPDNVTQIDGRYNTPCKKYTNSWSMISDLENRLIISEGKMEEFIGLLETLNLPLAINALKEGTKHFQAVLMQDQVKNAVICKDS